MEMKMSLGPMMVAAQSFGVGLLPFCNQQAIVCEVRVSVTVRERA